MILIISYDYDPSTNIGYVVKINIPSELITSYKKTVRYTPGMTATAEIITEDLSLFQRIFHSIRSVFEN